MIAVVPAKAGTQVFRALCKTNLAPAVAGETRGDKSRVA